MIFLSLLVVLLPTIASGGAYGVGPDQGTRYIGCYKDTSERALPYGPHAYGYTPDTCSVACQDYKYFALQNGGWCSCQTELAYATQYGEATNCPESRLGAGWANDLFENLGYEGPNIRYIGCYTDTSTRALPYGPHAYGYGPDTCAVACKDYKYFSLQHGGQCFCGNDLQDATQYGPATTCPENRLGAGWANDLFENLDFYGCTNEYLSDLAPLDEYQGWTDPNGVNTGVNVWFGDTMTMGNGNVYDKFLVIHPANDRAAYKTYSLNRVYKRFTAVVGPAQSGNRCPETFGEYGSFSIKISVDGIERYYRDGYGNDGYDVVNIDVTDAVQMTIEVDSPGNSASCDHATIAGPFIECENQCSPAVQSISATLSGDPHFRTWNGVAQHFQGDVGRNGKQADGRGNDVQYYLMTPCKDADRADQPFDLIGTFAQYGSVMSVENYLVLVLYDSYETYYVFLSGGIPGSDIPPIRAVYRRSDGATTNYLENQLQYIDEYVELNLDGDTEISDKFCITISEADDSAYKLLLTDRDDGCTLEIYNRLEGNKGTYRWHWLEIQPPTCYKCTNCGLLGDFQTPYGESSLIGCDGERIFYDAPWKPTEDGFDPIGWTYEKEYHDNFCGIPEGDFDAPEGFACDSEIQQQADIACQQARDELDICCRNIGGGFCTIQQEACEADVCFMFQDGDGEMDDLVNREFTEIIIDYCNNQNAQGPVPRLLYDFEDGTFDETMTGDEKYRLQPGFEPYRPNTAQIINGVLVCDGNGYIMSENNLDFDIGSHTFEVLLELNNVNSQGGAMSLDSSYNPYGGYSLNQFDAIVYNQEGDNRWTLGSEYNSRTLTGVGNQESSAGQYIHLVAVYDAEQQRAKLYRNGVEQQNFRPGGPYAPGFFTAGADANAKLLFCRKNFDDADSNFNGNIRYGAYYDFALAEDQVLQLYDNSMVQVCGTQFEVIGDELKPDQSLYPGQALRSLNGRFVAAMQNDGDFVVYDLGDDAFNAEKLFSTGTSGTNYLVLQSIDGNLVVYTVDDDEEVYATNALSAGSRPLFLLMQDDGNLVAYKKGELTAVPYWDMKGVSNGATSGQIDIVNNDNGFNHIVSSTTNEGTLSIKSMMKYGMYMGIILLFTNIMCVLICSEIRKRYKIVKVSEIYSDDQILK